MPGDQQRREELNGASAERPGRHRHRALETLLRPTIGRRQGQPALLIGGAVQSVIWQPGIILDGYWEAMIPPVCPHRALLLGLGGGTIAALLANRCPNIHITGVERSIAVLDLARHHFGLDAIPNLHVILGDAIEVTAQLDGPFDYIGVDLYVGGAIATGALRASFLRAVAAQLAPGGVVYINLVRTRRLPQQLRQIERVFTIQEQVTIKDNVVARCTPAARNTEL